MKHERTVNDRKIKVPAAFRRLCVETTTIGNMGKLAEPAAFRRLCVETVTSSPESGDKVTSRLQAAVC